MTPDIAKEISFQSVLDPEHEIIKDIETKIFIAAINGKTETESIEIKSQILLHFPKLHNYDDAIEILENKILDRFKKLGYTIKFDDHSPSISWG